MATSSGTSAPGLRRTTAIISRYLLQSRSRKLPAVFASTCRLGTETTVPRRAPPRSAVQAPHLLSHGGMVSFINLGPYSFVRVELLPLTPNGPYRLTVEHPAKTLVEYF